MSECVAPLVLVVEDDPMISQMIGRMLKVAGYEVRIAHDAETAMDELSDVRPTLITLDLRLPGMGGAAFLQQLRAAPQTADLAVILITAEEQIEADVRNLADALLAKPFGMDELIALVQATIARTQVPLLSAVA